MRCLVFRSDGFHPYRNQAAEAALLELADDETEILYLWQNDKTVFIGKHQNAYTECKVPVIEGDGGFIARRISGGGAVYHDKGNLNFTFLSKRSNYSVQKNFVIMMTAMKKLGFGAELNGRNDVVIGGRKFSGNAFYRGAEKCFHHGTVLINADREKLSRYLNVSSVKLAAKGVKSVVSRIVNLGELDASVTPDKVADALVASFGEYYGVSPQLRSISDIEGENFDRWLRKFEDEKWRLGDDVCYDAQLAARFEWGTADIRLKMNGTVIEAAKIYSDCLDDVIAEKEKLLVGADIYKGKEGAMDIIEAFKEQRNGF